MTSKLAVQNARSLPKILQAEIARRDGKPENEEGAI
jgi:hypothetical protein